jgi:hypothetical protein
MILVGGEVRVTKITGSSSVMDLLAPWLQVPGLENRDYRRGDPLR